jgi:hypothetical protein
MELLIATTISIMVMGATVTLFGVVGDRINGGRAMIETSDRLRAVQNLLRRDLGGHTSPLLPWADPAAGNGYFEIIKGPNNTDLAHQRAGQTPLLGYTRDVLMLTTRSPDQPFTGRFIDPSGNLTTFESPIAEVVWYLQPTFNPQGQMAGANGVGAPTYTLYRRQFLIVASAPPLKIGIGNTQNLLKNYYDNYDVSAHFDGKGNMVANSLVDLTYRENRFAHNTSLPFPYPVNFPAFNSQNPSPLRSAPSYNANSLTPFPSDDSRFGEDVVLTNVLSFDIKVWDPGVQVFQDNGSPTKPPLVPSDIGYGKGQAITDQSGKAVPQYGAYVDLNHNNTTPLPWNPGIPPDYFLGPYYGNGLNYSGLAAGSNSGYATFDTWSLGYEYLNYGMKNGQVPNQANNGFDDGPNQGKYGVDNATERLTCPPYPVPLRGVQITIRVYEPSTRQVRQITVTESFTPD